MRRANCCTAMSLFSDTASDAFRHAEASLFFAAVEGRGNSLPFFERAAEGVNAAEPDTLPNFG